MEQILFHVVLTDQMLYEPFFHVFFVDVSVWSMYTFSLNIYQHYGILKLPTHKFECPLSEFKKYHILSKLLLMSNLSSPNSRS